MNDFCIEVTHRFCQTLEYLTSLYTLAPTLVCGVFGASVSRICAIASYVHHRSTTSFLSTAYTISEATRSPHSDSDQIRNHGGHHTPSRVLQKVSMQSTFANDF
jgi:hypothetical protein